MNEEKRWDNAWTASEPETVQEGLYQESDSVRQGYYQESEVINRYHEPEKKPSQAFGIASLVCGILSIVCFYSCCNILTAVLAVIFGIVQLVQNKSGKGFAIAGIITAVVSVVLLVAFYLLLMLSTDFEDMMGEDFLENYEYYQELLPEDFELEDELGLEDTF